jgi:5-methylcytosine-specific restriction endonuclease McrA
MNYLRIYNKIIKRAKNRINDGYIEKHHIIPKSMGGSNNISNIVELTPREHFLAHWLLYRIYPQNKSMIYAFWMMSNRFKNLSSSAYEESKIAFSKATSKRMSGENHPMFNKNHSQETIDKISYSRKEQGNYWNGKTHTPESKSKMSVSAKNRNMSEEAKAARNQKLSESASGVKKSEEHKKNIALAKVGANNPMYGKKAKQVTCPHCNKTLGVNMASRYHFKNCKSLKV